MVVFLGFNTFDKPPILDYGECAVVFHVHSDEFHGAI
jgi:hypothetical protein